ncbi:DUF6932 family protein [Mycolicibacterium fortuitum]|uniref:DUF6932 family protein n=1 Tax=Mycolicibacterium fortuitum TaxID=1766 RepID=UPI001AEFFF37|nr:hypothetical protein [Mycolicibacterium fortuitum]MBP3083718.1 hypothetical protein [Mycolicibacterium fortuitum]
MIPSLVDGHLPIGTFPCTLEEIEQNFVEDAVFANSSTRRSRFDGLIDYLYEWEQAQLQLDTKVLKRIWIGGSFTSSQPEVGDVDISPILDSDALASLSGRVGVGRIKALFEQRTKVRETYHVEPFPVLWKPFTTIKLRNLDAEEYEYVATRGMMDDFWQRTRHMSVKGAMLVEDAEPARGYLEVTL